MLNSLGLLSDPCLSAFIRGSLFLSFAFCDLLLGRFRLGQVLAGQFDELSRTADDPGEHKAFLLRASLLEGAKKLGTVP